MSRQLVQCRERKDILENILNLERLERAMVKVEDILNRNYESGQDMIALAANRELRGVFETLARISDALLEVKRLEFEQTQADKKIDLSDLSVEELQVAFKLGIKMSGELADLLSPSGEALCFDTVLDAEPEEAPIPIPRPARPLPPPKTPFKPILKADIGDEQLEPGDSPGEPEAPKPPALPPRPSRPLPGWDDSCMRGKGGARKA